MLNQIKRLFTGKSNRRGRPKGVRNKPETQARRREEREVRAKRFAEMYKTMTLEEIGALEGITRERVRQIMKPLGITYKDGVKHRVALSKQARKSREKVNRRERRCQKEYGCSYVEYRQITEGGHFYIALDGAPHKRKHGCPEIIRRWGQHRHAAQQVGADWELTLPEYYELVRDHLADFSRTRGGKVLARKNKNGPYSKDNLEIITLEENSRRTGGISKAVAFNVARLNGDKKMSLQELADALGCSKQTVTNMVATAKQIESRN